MNRGRILTISLAVALVVGACSGGPGRRPEASGPRTGGGSISLSSLSGRIAFDNQDDVWIINADGTDLRRLTHSPWPEFDPSWSPDGRFIAYRSEPHGQPELWVMNADGTGQHRLTRDGGIPDWSPDGSMIAYGAAGGPGGSSIAIMNADGSGQRRLPHTEGGEYPSWSPDGTRIAFNSNLTGDHVMYIAQADGSKVVDLSSVGEGWQVAWSPDGRSILFESSRDYSEPGYGDVYVVRPDGTGIRRLTHQRAYAPAWSPDGQHIVFSAPGLFVMNPDGTGVTPLPTDVGETALPDWTD